jgi:formylglycine-generating enzyme required for sulfatase activity
MVCSNGVVFEVTGGRVARRWLGYSPGEIGKLSHVTLTSQMVNKLSLGNKGRGSHMTSRAVSNASMVRSGKWSLPGAVLVVCLQASVVLAQGISNLNWLKVGDPGNTANSGFGAVSTDYWIMKFEWTNDQYVQFLNTVDPTGANPNGIYSNSMGTNLRGGIAYTAGGSAGAKYSARTNMGSKPVNYLSWFSAARVANWLQNGATGSSSTETGAYTLNGQTTGTIPAINSGAQYWIPTENEWYKAAFYKGGSTNAGYWLSAAQSASNPTAVTATPTGDGSAGATGNSANFNNAAIWNGLTGNLTTVGTNGGPSAYGTFDQGGNAWEWTSTLSGSNPVIRGGATSWGNANNASRFTGRPSSELGENQSFRLVTAVPEPSTTVLAAAGLALGGWWLRRRATTRMA